MINKQIYIECPLLIFTILMMTSACSDFLNKDPYDRPATEVELSTIDGFTRAINGTYDAMCGERYYGKLFIACSEYMGEDVMQKSTDLTNDTYGEVYRYNKGAETDEIGRLWEYCYDVLLRANNILYYLPVCTDGTDEEQAEIKGQALFVRALAHFDLLRAYGQTFTYTEDASHIGVPVVTRPLSVIEVPSRNTVIEGYKQVITDLDSAILIFPDEKFVSSDAKYGNRYAAMALLSRVYMYTSEYKWDNDSTGWQNCIYWASQVLNDASSPLKLIAKDDYVESWATLEPSSESIFELAYTKASTSNLGLLYYPSKDESNSEAVPSYDLLQLYTPIDMRVDMFHISSSSGQVYSKKYPGSDGQVGLDDIKILRLSEVYLNRAEAYAQCNKLTEAMADLNKIRNRAGLNDVESSLSQEELLEEIYTERRRELAFEGHRIWDITRRHQDVVRNYIEGDMSYETITYPNSQFVFPIPQDEMDANDNMVQNEGYE